VQNVERTEGKERNQSGRNVVGRITTRPMIFHMSEEIEGNSALSESPRSTMSATPIAKSSRQKLMLARRRG
jgi:hypothetical protein